MRFASIVLLTSLAACGRKTEDVDVRLVGVGMDPEEIGPSPTPYGGVVEYNNVEFAGGGLSLSALGFLSFDEVGPQSALFAPPYRAVTGTSYLFDQKLTAADSFTFSSPATPVTEGSCYTAYSPEGPIGSFSTVDVGDVMEFVSADGTKRFSMARNPYDVPPDARDLFVYYFNVEPWAPVGRSHKVPGEDATNPRAMIEEVYSPPNYPFGEEMTYRFPGGVTRHDMPISSIPRPSSAAATPPTVTLPADPGGVLLRWNGPRFDGEGEIIGEEGEQAQCLEFYGDGRETPPATAADCASTTPEYPTGETEFDRFPGQIYTGPWDTEDGKLTIEWERRDNSDQVTFAVRFLAAVDPSDTTFATAMHGDRPATACEEADATYAVDPEVLESPAMKGDPLSRMVEVSCMFEDDGIEEIDLSKFADALEYTATHSAGGVLFFFGRGTEAAVDVPPAKDAYDQLHEISPVLITTRATRIGRFHWDGAPAGGEE